MHSVRFPACLLGCTVLLFVAGLEAVRTQPANPAPPDKDKIAIRYDIPAARDEHVARYKAMIEHLDKIGLQFEPKLKPFPNSDYEDRGKNILTGFIAPYNLLDCLNSPSVASLLVMPANFVVPEVPTQPVRVRLELKGGFPASRQLVLANQVRVLLGQLGFQESVGYDDRGYAGKPHTRIVGTIPAENLLTLLKDLRTQPTGWLAPRIATETLPAPVSDVVPIVVTEVLAGQAEESQPSLPSTKRGQDYLDKITPDLWAMVVSKDEDAKIVRAEIILSYVPAAGDESYRAALMNEAPSLWIEGRLGPVVTALLRVNQASGLAGLPQVSVVRLARPALVSVDSAVKFAGDIARALQQSGLATLHQRGFKGKGVRIGIIDSDFRGHETLVREGKLPKATRLVDLTTEFNPDIYPDPQLGDPKAMGHGTQCALAAALAAPEAELTLIRIDPASLPQLQFVAKLINGEPALDDHLTRRLDEIRTAAQVLIGRRDEIARERKAILDNFEDDGELKHQYEILGPVVRGWLFTPREWLNARLDELERDREVQRRLEQRFERFFESLKKLKGINIVATSLVWNDGYPLAGGSPLSQWFEEDQSRKALWFVSTGNTRGQTWTGSFRDLDGNGVMEFTTGSQLAPGTWTPELNFLAWQPHEERQVLELPEGAKVRITAQWQEPHDPSYFWQLKERDRYLKPLAELALVVLRQRDPTGKVLPQDDFEVAGRSQTAAFRIENRPGGSVYEQVVEFSVAKPGRYALRVERQLPKRWELRMDSATGRPMLVEIRGLAAAGIRPADAPILPALESHWELSPRIFVGVIDPLTTGKGRVVFRDYSTSQGSIPMLADTRSLIAVGAADWNDVQRPYSASGAPGTLWNFAKPNVMVYDGLTLTPQGTGSAYGTSLATPFAAGMAATLLSAGERQPFLEAKLQKLQGTVWKLGKSP